MAWPFGASVFIEMAALYNYYFDLDHRNQCICVNLENQL